MVSGPTSGHLNVVCWNINGNLARKLVDIQFIKILKAADIAVIIESKLCAVDHIDLSFLGFSLLFRNERSNRSGGVLIAVKSSLAPFVKEEINVSGKEQLYIRILDNLVVGGIYIPPRESVYFDKFDRFEYLQDCIERISSTCTPYVLVGDFNA